jgi:hypothetical protein
LHGIGGYGISAAQMRAKTVRICQAVLNFNDWLSVNFPNNCFTIIAMGP